MNWKIIATKDEEKIRGWFEKFDKLNYAVATGRKSLITNKYLVVVDIDDSEHKLLNQLPPTFGYKTGGGGWHLWYWADIPVKNSVSLIANKVDIRGTDGYVVIPPSKHISGKQYQLLNNTKDISVFPPLLTELLKQSYRDIKAKKHSKPPGNVSLLLKTWNAYSIPTIRTLLSQGTLVPEGIRNVVVHRLLSSDRAKGVQTRQELMQLALSYHGQLENSSSMDSDELQKIVSSVEKYPAYNNSHEKVNENYVKWLRKNHVATDADIKQKLDSVDQEFFNSLISSPDGMPLVLLDKEREKFFVFRGFKTISKYKPALLGKKLRELGFKRQRTAKANYWLIAVDFNKLR